MPANPVYMPDRLELEVLPRARTFQIVSSAATMKIPPRRAGGLGSVIAMELAP